MHRKKLCEQVNKLTVREVLKEGSDLLKKNNIETACLDSSLLLAESLAITKEKLYASFPDSVSDRQYTVFKEYIIKRAEGHPVAYLLQKGVLSHF